MRRRARNPVDNDAAVVDGEGRNSSSKTENDIVSSSELFPACAALCQQIVMVQLQHQNHIENGVTGGVVNRGGGDGALHPENNSIRVRRPLLVGRRIIGGPSTPVPRWKLYENPFYDGIAGAAAQQKNGHGGGGGGVRGRDTVVSARKLAATLWELQEFPFTLNATSNKSSLCPCVQHTNSAASAVARKSRYHLLPSADQNATSSSPPSSYCGSGPHPECFRGLQADIAKESTVSLHHPNKAWGNGKKTSLGQATSNRQVAAMRSHVHRLLERRADARLSQLASVQGSSGSYMVLNRIQNLQELQEAATSTSSIVDGLQSELERARSRAHELELAHKSVRREFDNVLKKVTEEKATWRNKEQENIRSAVLALKMEAEEEKAARRRIESFSRKTSRELIDANMAVAKVVQELERERKARELMEDVCDELAREIGEDKAEVEDLKRESAKVREEVEEERKMLQMAEVWREERVQMKLAEARLEIEDKNAVLDNLKEELESFLKSRKAFLEDAEEDEASCRAAVQEAEDLRRAMDSLQLREALENSCRLPETDEEASGPLEEQSDSNDLQQDERVGWGRSAKLSSVLGGLDATLETRDQVLERLRRKYNQNGEQTSAKGAQNSEGGGIWEDERDVTEWNSHSGHQGDDSKDDDGSQWESASDQDIVDATQQSNSQSGTRGSEYQGGPQADVQGHPGEFDRHLSPQRHSLSSAEHASKDNMWKVTSPSLGLKKDGRQRLSVEGHKSLLGIRGQEVSRSSHMRMVSEQGIPSPLRNWRSPDTGNPHIARGIKGFIEWPKMSREHGIKGKALESNAEIL